MKEKLLKIRHIASDTATMAVIVIMLVITVFLFVCSMILTADMSVVGDDLEVLTFSFDNIAVNLLLMVCCCAIGIGLIFAVLRFGLLIRFSSEQISWLLFAWTFLASVLWIVQALSYPTHDSFLVTRAGVSAANGDYSFLKNQYFIRFPFQSGYVLFTEIISRLLFLNHRTYIVLQLVNGLCLAFAEMALVRLTDRIFCNRSITFFTAVALMAFSQPVIFSTFLYGILPGFCFAVWASLFFIGYIKDGRRRDIIISSLLITVSIWLKLNNLIFAVAMAIVLILHSLKGKGIKQLAALAVFGVIVLGLKNVPVWQYELRCDHDFGDGIPMTCWLAMGLDEANTAPGWYESDHTVKVFHDVGCDSKKASEIAINTVKERLSYFSSHPSYAANFFFDKINSQWNETSFQSIWNNQVRGQMGDRVGVAKLVCGSGEKLVKRLMDINVEFLYLGAAVSFTAFAVDFIKKKSIGVESVLIPIVIIGGFLYHALFEAKSQYVLTYVTVMIPYSVYGFYRLLSALRGCKEKIPFNKKQPSVA